MSLKNCFYKQKHALLALMIISLFIGSSYVSVLAFSQNSTTNYLPNLLNYLQTNNVNAKDCSTGWLMGDGAITVIERVESNYNTYCENWEYRYVDGKVQTRVNHTIQNPSCNHVLFGHKDGWNLASADNGTPVGGTNYNYADYYWIQIQSSSSPVTVTFDVDQLYTYGDLNILTGNEPILVTDADITRSGNVFRFTPKENTYSYSLQPRAFQKDTYNAPPGAGEDYGFSSGFIDVGYPSELASSNNVYRHQALGSYSYKTIYLKAGFTPNDYIDSSYGRVTKVTMTYEGVAMPYWSFWLYGFEYYGRGPGYTIFHSIPVDGLDHIISVTWNPADGGNGYYQLGARAWCDWVPNLLWWVSQIDLKSDQFSAYFEYANRYSTCKYYSGSWNTSDYPLLLVKYRTSSNENWVMSLTEGMNNYKKQIVLNGSTDWKSVELNIQEGETYDGFYLNSSAFNSWIEFDYVLTGRRVEVNSLDQNSKPNLQLWGDDSTQQLGTPNYPLFVSGTIREMDGYSNPDSNLPCTLELWKEGVTTAVYTANVSGVFNHSITSYQLSDGNYTVKIKPHWENLRYYDVELAFSVYPLKVYYDYANPIVKITEPPNDSNPVNYGEVWINGTYDGTGSRVTNITINDNRFTLVKPSEHPYSYTGTFSFKSAYILKSEFDVNVTAQDRWGNIGTATRHIVVVDPDNPNVTITSPSSDDIVAGFGTVWINGIFNGTGSRVTNITINDTRFNLVKPTGSEPYGEIGEFSFRSSVIIEPSVFVVNVTVQDEAGLKKTVTRQVRAFQGEEGYLVLDFTVLSADGKTILPARLYTSYSDRPLPLVVLVHGFAETLYLWERPFINDGFDQVRVSLINDGFTVVAYTQRPGASTADNVGSFDYLMMDLYEVIDTANHLYGGILVDATRIGLVGWSLGSYVVTMAACEDLNYLKEYQKNLKVVVDGAGPKNLFDRATFLSHFPSFDVWYANNLEAFSLSKSPIEQNKPDAFAAISTQDHCDWIKVPFVACHNIYDMLIPSSDSVILTMDIEYDLGKTANSNVFLYLSTDPATQHMVWLNTLCIGYALTYINMYM